jgi:nitrogen fixation/metabolism regulation signal transduction histidine kinase
MLTVLAALAASDAVRLAGRRERVLRGFAEALMSGAVERPANVNAADRNISEAVELAAERIEHERAKLRSESDRLAALVDTVSAALYVLDPDGTIRFSNRAAHRLLPQPSRRFSEMSAVGLELGRKLEVLAPGAREMAKLADGRSVLAGSAIFTGPEGEPLRLVSLQTLVGELDPIEIKAWQDLSRVLAHEMMNSLAPIVSLTESLEEMLARPEGMDRTQIARAIETIGRRSAGLMRFVERYRRMAEVPPAELAPIDLGDFVSDIVALVGAGFEFRGIRLKTHVEPQELTVEGDVELLSQAVLNLLKNAAEASAGCATPHVTLSCLSATEGVAISVEDIGHGVPQDTDLLFLPFYTTRPENDGIGLSIVRQVALAHRGTIRVERMQPGARFTLLLPSS